MATNIQNTTTGQAGYQVPGTPIPQGWTSTAVNTAPNANDIATVRPTVIPSTAPAENPATPIIAGAQASQEAAQAEAEKNIEAANSGVKQAQENKNTTLDYIKGLVGQETTAQTERATGADQQGIDQATKDLTDINKQIADTNVKYRAAVDEANATAPSLQGAQSLKAVADANYGRQLADLAIRQSAANGNVEALTKAADEKLKLKLAPLETEINYYKDFIVANEDQLTQSEKDKANQIIAEKQRILTQQKDEENIGNTALKTALENGVKIPDNIVQRVLADPKNAYNTLASNGISLENPLDKLSTQTDIDYKKAQIEKLKADTAKAVKENSPEATSLKLAQVQSSTAQISDLLKTPFFANAVSPNAIGRINLKNMITGEKDNFIASVEQIRSQLNLDTLIQAKGQGATFGALSDQELRVLASAGTKIGSWAIKDKDGNVTGYKANPKDFRAEMDRINNFAKLDYILKGGKPEDVGVQQMPDGKLVTKNSDGSFTEIQ